MTHRMSKQRYLRPKDWTNASLLRLSLCTRLTWDGLLQYADDEGIGVADALLMKSTLHPLDESVTATHMLEALLELADIGFLRLYAAGDQEYFQIEASRRPRVDGTPTPSEHPSAPIRTESEPDSDRIRVVGERGEEEEARRREAPLGSSSEPSPFCPEHPGGTFDKCGPCGTARKQNEIHIRNRKHQQTDTEE